MVKEFCVLLDNGHGVSTPGKCSPVWSDGSQLKEWKYTREITNLIKEKLDKLGIKCVRLVPEDGDVSLSNRANRANKYITNYQCVFVSVHCNAAAETNQGTGWEIWSTKSKNNSDKFAQCFLDVFKDVMPNKRLRGHKEKNFTVIYNTNCPAVLTENFFMNTQTECEWMLSEEGREAIADLHVAAILLYKQRYCKTSKTEPVKVSKTLKMPAK